MSDAVVHRLSKVAKELNVSVATIAAYLKSKGQAIEVNPNAKLSAEQYNLVLDGFVSDKKDKEESKRIHEEKEKRKTLTVEDTSSISERTIRAREEDELVIRNASEEIIRAPKAQELHIKEVGKIDLDSFNKKKKEEPQKEKVKPVERERKEEKHIPVPEPAMYKTI